MRALVPLVLALLGLGVAPAAAAADHGCVTRAELRRVTEGMPKAHVHDLFDTRGRFADGGAGGYARAYHSCGSAEVSVEFEVTDSGVHRATWKTWHAEGHADDRPGDGTPA